MNLSNTIDLVQIKKPNTASQNRNLSPFTWTNIKLPEVKLKTKSEKQTFNDNHQIKIPSITQQFNTIDTIKKQQNKITLKKKQKQSLNRTSIDQIVPQTLKSIYNKPKQSISLHQKVLKQFQRRKIIGQKKYNKVNNSLSGRQKQFNMIKNQKNTSFIQKQQLQPYSSVDLKQKRNIQTRVSQRYETIIQKRNITTQQSNNHKKKYFKQQITQQKSPYQSPKNMHLLKNYKADIAFGRTLQVDKSHYDKKLQINMSSITKLNESINLEQNSHKSFSGHYGSSRNIKDIVFNEMEPYLRKYFTKNSKNPNKLQIFVTSNPKYIPLHENQFNSSAFQMRSSPRSDQKNQENQEQNTQKKKEKNKIFWLIWTKNPLSNIFIQKSKNQFYNHIQGAHVLTSKQKLNQILGNGCKQFYPISFSLPSQYKQFASEYDMILIKVTLKYITNRLDNIQNYKQLISSTDQTSNQQKGSYRNSSFLKPSVCLGQIIEDLIHQTENQEQIKLLKLCLVLQFYRKKINLVNYFEKMYNYKEIQINVSQNLYIDVIQWCLKLKNKLNLLDKQQKQLESNQPTSSPQIINLSNVDFRLIKLLKSYNNLFQLYLPSYMYQHQQKNMWIVKPFASSKAAGISLLNQTQDFYTTYDYVYKQYKHKSKFNNKMLMKYIQNPLLINYYGKNFWLEKTVKQIQKKNQQKFAKKSEEIITKQHDLESSHNEEQQFRKKQNQFKLKISYFMSIEQTFAHRKFDIRQWIIIVCDQNQQLPSKNSNESPKRKRDNTSLLFNRRRSNPSIMEDRTGPKTFKLYKYHTGYCRFSKKQYKVDSNDLQIHLTNYELYKSKQDGRRSPDVFSKQKQQLQTSNKRVNKLNSSNSKNKQTSLDQQRSNKSINKRFNQNESLKTIKERKTKNKKQPESVLMLNDLFQYFQFIQQINQDYSLDKKISLSNQIYNPGMSYSQYYQKQLDHILQKVFYSCKPYLSYNSKTFQLFGIDLLLDEHFNLYLEQINLSPGCASQRSQKLNKQVNLMLDELFSTLSKNGKTNQNKSQQIEEHSIIHQQQEKQSKWILIDSYPVVQTGKKGK